MRRINLSAMRLAPVALLVMILVGQAMAFESHEVEKEKREPDEIVRIPAYVPPKVTPPMRARGVDAEKFEYKSSDDPKYFNSYELYLDKFILWTSDSALAVKAIGNDSYIKSVEKAGNGVWAITVMTGDVMKGKQLRSLLRETNGVGRVENYAYSQNTELIPSDIVKLKLCEASDSVKLKSIADSLHLIVHKDETFNTGIKWNLQLTLDTKLSRLEIVKIIQNSLKTVYCSLQWYGGGFYPAFTYDTYINRQWGLYNRQYISQPLKKKYTDIDISRGWNFATGRG